MTSQRPPTASRPLIDLDAAARAEIDERVDALVARWDPATRAGWDADGGIPRTVFAEIARSGLFRACWQAEAPADRRVGLALIEALAPISSGLALAVLTHNEVFMSALAEGQGTALGHLAQGAVDGDVIGCLAVTEDSAGSDMLEMATVARPVAGGWTLDGRKRFVSNGRAATHAVVLAREPELADRRNLSLFVVELDGVAARCDGVWRKAGLHACDTASLVFEEAFVPESAVIGHRGMGPVHVRRALVVERLAICCLLIAAARCALGLAVAFARRRQVAGGSVMTKQAVRHRLADAAAALWSIEAMFTAVVDDVGAGRRADHRTAALKLLCGRTAQQVVDDAMQVFGGRGYTDDFPVQQWWRDVRLGRIGGGTDEIMREIVGSHLDRSDAGYEVWLDQIWSVEGATP